VSTPRCWRVRSIGVAGSVAMVVVMLGGCTSIQSIYSLPPAPQVTMPPSPPAVETETPAPPPAQKAPEPAKTEPEAPAPQQESPPPPPTPPTKAAPPPAVKREPATPPPAQKAPEPAKKEPETPPAKKEVEIPPPVLAPQVGKGDEEQLKRTASSRIQRAEQLIGQLDSKKLTGDQQERLLTVQNLLGNARDALGAQDLAKASNLADKARILAEELAQTVK
jgi:hypothetical protein